MVYTVSEMAKLMNVAPSTLRFYDKEGLLPFVERSSSGTRIFTEHDFGWLQIISCLKSAGMSIKEIRRYIELSMVGDDTIDARLKMFLDQRERILKQMAELQQTLDTVDYKCWYYETAKAHGSEDVPKNMTYEELPEKFRAIRKRLRGTQNDK